MSLRTGDYRPRNAEHTVLYRVIDEHLDACLETARRHHADGAPLPAFMEQKSRDLLTCGVLAHGFARLRCMECALERLVPFSCKGRGFCPSCGGRRMTEGAARLVDGVLPRVPVRQWVLSLPYRLRTCSRGITRWRARCSRWPCPCCSASSGTARAAPFNVHFHTLLLDGVFFEGPDRALEFRPLPPPTDEEVGVVLARIAVRVQRLLRRRRLDPWEADDGVQADPRGARGWRLGDEPDAPWALSTASRHAHLAGFDLHANVAVPAADRARLEQLCRYLFRPAVAQDRLRLLADGRVVLTLKSAWTDGTRQLLFEPVTLLEKLAALIPRPRINLVV